MATYYCLSCGRLLHRNPRGIFQKLVIKSYCSMTGRMVPLLRSRP